MSITKSKRLGSKAYLTKITVDQHGNLFFRTSTQNEQDLGYSYSAHIARIKSTTTISIFRHCKYDWDLKVFVGKKGIEPEVQPTRKVKWMTIKLTCFRSLSNRKHHMQLKQHILLIISTGDEAYWFVQQKGNSFQKPSFQNWWHIVFRYLKI